MATLVLGLETSCDETAAAVVADGRQVLSNVVHSQVALHARHRGVVPEIASRSHTQRVLPIVDLALEGAGVTSAQLDAVAVTHRPGMVGCLLVGMAAAKALCLLRGIPLVGVDHVQAHVQAAFLAEPDMPVPALALVASGGHTALWLVRTAGSTERLGTTRDDAAGEALDKAAALLGLPYPGGPAIQEAATRGDPNSLHLPRSLLAPDSLDFSFSGLKTALLYHLRGSGAVREMPELSARQVADLAAAFQAAVVDVLIEKILRAVERHPVKALCIGGGVARNTRLRAALKDHPELRGLRLVLPPMDLCTDNGAMVAALGHLLLQQGAVSGLDLDALATAQASPKARTS